MASESPLAVATHDGAMIDAAIGLMHEMPDRQAPVEFQMLYGVRRDLQSKVVSKGYRLRLYVPYGAAWYPYFMRRLGERPANVGFVLRGIFGEH